MVCVMTAVSCLFGALRGTNMLLLHKKGFQLLSSITRKVFGKNLLLRIIISLKTINAYKNVL